MWHCDQKDSIGDESIVELGLWNNEIKTKKLSLIKHSKARNLLFQIFSLDPKTRPSATRVLAHPFFSGILFFIVFLMTYLIFTYFLCVLLCITKGEMCLD